MACDALLDMALGREARDNITAVVVRADDPRSPERTIIQRATGSLPDPAALGDDPVAP